MNPFRYNIEEYSKGSSKEYTVHLKHSQSMQLAHKTVLEVIEKYFRDIKSVNMLEIGGGHGTLTKDLMDKGHVTTNVTNNPEEFKHLESEKQTVVLKDMHHLEGLTDFDLVLCSHVYEHSFAPYILMSEFNEVLKHRGIVVIIVPDQDDKWVFEPYHYIVPTADHLKNLGQKCGFETVSCEVVDYLGMNHLIYIGTKDKDWKVCRNE